MGGKPRNFGVREHRPSPLKQEVSQRPVSMQSHSMGLVRDPMFWKRFSTAVHMSEVDLKELESGYARERVGRRKDPYDGGEDWLDQQYKEKRRCRFICIGVTFLVAILVAAAVVVVLYFTERIHF
ncbi:hypothetical protein EAF04_009641 [Stromatinia cepivora]|nr:hypothetical protein EAF04_009641 [Stromatinia cepivora]